MERSQKIIRTSIIGIAVNVVLVLFKMAVGFISGSIAIILDAVNNLGDALSSIITIFGTKLAAKAPDREHPYGHGRIEYLASVLISGIVLAAGITSAKESIIKALHPEQASYTPATLVILVAAVVAKLLCGRYVKAVGEKVKSQSLIASGSDAFFDAVLSFATLVAAIVSILWGISLEGILGVVISLIIMKAGFEMLMDTLSSIIGVRADGELTRAIKKRVKEIDGVRGAYDLMLHNYGPTEMIGSIHVEVADSTTAQEIHKMTHEITATLYKEFGIIMTVGIYASNSTDERAKEYRKKVSKIIGQYPEVLQMHGFYVDWENKLLSFDLVLDFQSDTGEIRQQVLDALQQLLPDYQIFITLDIDYSD
ncbi:MAG: cation diffusion facilitator family transporter [Eubacteriales bacterium]|nr:cation diffusion facilitator family transporter [Eubacteriales bacterium]